jgi:hypothetical protein
MGVNIAPGDTVAYRPNNGYMTTGKVRSCAKVMVVIEHGRADLAPWENSTINQMPTTVMVLNTRKPIPEASE